VTKTEEEKTHLLSKCVAENLKQFQEMGFNLVDVNLRRHDEGDGIEKTSRLKSASWYKSCFSKVGNWFDSYEDNTRLAV
jgi:hypothetical protein